jgi:hypothetical protein
MQRTLLVVLFASLVVLAGCSGGTTDDGAPTTSGGGDGENATDDGGTGDEAATADGADGESREPELLQLQFDRVERYEYETEAFGSPGNLVLDVESVTDETATVRIDYDLGGQATARTYEVPAGDREAFVRAAERETYAGAVLVVQSNDATITFVENDIEWAVGSVYDSQLTNGNITVTGRDTIAGVDCLTYETVIEGQAIQDGCISPDHEVAIEMTQYLGDGTVRTRLTLTDYEQG